MRSIIVPLAGLLLMLVSACGDPGDAQGAEPSPPADTEPGATSSPADPEAPIGSQEPEPSASPTIATPRPGTEDTRALPFERWEQEGPRIVRLIYWSGVPPCEVLDHVEVDTTPDTVTLRILVGRDPAAPADTACIQIAELTAVDVTLPEPLGDREIIDGAQ